MPRRPSRRLARGLAATSLLIAAPTLAACGFDVQTDQPYQPAVGSNQRGTSTDVLGATVVLPDDSTDGTLSASFANGDPSNPVELTGVTGEGVQVQLLDTVEVPAGGLLNLSDTGSVLVTFDEERTPGGYTRLTLAFDNGDSIEVNVPVVNDEEEFADVVLAEAPSPSASPSDSPSGSPSPSATGSPEAPAEEPSASPTE